MKISHKYNYHKLQLLKLIFFGLFLFGFSCSQSQKTIRYYPLEYKVIPAKTQNETKKPLLILLHGFGSNEDDLAEIFSNIDSNLITVCLRAPIELSENRFAWYELSFKDGAVSDYNKEQAKESLNAVRRFIKDFTKENNCNMNEVYLLGFSQGAMISLEFMISNPELISGIVALSGKFSENISEKISTKADYKHLSAFIGHGKSDKVVPIEYARKVKQILSESEIRTSYHEYDAEHSITADELIEIRNWIKQELEK